MKANLESVLLDFRVEAGRPRPGVLEAYCRRYPQFAHELTDYAVDWLLDEAIATAEPAEVAASGSSPIVSKAISHLYDRIRERDAGKELAARSREAPARNPFQALSPQRKRAICAQIGVDMPLFAKFQNRLVEAGSVPRAFLGRFAHELQDTVEGFLSYLTLPPMTNPAGEYKAEGKPSASAKKESFEDAVRASSLDEKQKQELLKG